MAWEGERKTRSSKTPDTRLLHCSECDNLQPARRNDDGDLVPIGGASGGRCPQCGESGFDPVVLDPDGN